MGAPAEREELVGAESDEGGEHSGSREQAQYFPAMHVTLGAEGKERAIGGEHGAGGGSALGSEGGIQASAPPAVQSGVSPARRHQVFKGGRVRLTLPTLALFAAPLLARSQGTSAAPPTPRDDSMRAAARLDTDGLTAQAREAFQRLIESAPDPAAKASAQRAMAISYAFGGDCANAAKYEDLVIAYWATREQAEPDNAFYQQGEIADEAARICIDAGDLKTAERYYRRGYALGVAEPAPKKHPVSLWDYRLAHALARLAARRGDRAEAQHQVAEARRILDGDSAMAAQQERFFPYLIGYVALYTGDLPPAEKALSAAIALKGNGTDPFLTCLLAMTYEKMGDRAKAQAFYRKAYDLATGHNPPSAFTRPYARKKLGE